MSSNRRGTVFQNRWNQVGVRKPKKFSREEIKDYCNRMIKRMNKAAGYEVSAKPSEWRLHNVFSSNPAPEHTVIALTKSEARAKFKRMLGKNLNGYVVRKGNLCQISTP